jgi:hypothetical protein
MAVLPDGLGVGGNDGVAAVAAGDLLHPMLKVGLVDLLCGRLFYSLSPVVVVVAYIRNQGWERVS